MLMPGRRYSITNTNYRYGFNGKENDNEVKGEGNSIDYGARESDPRIGGRFWSVDPLTRKFPYYSPYQFAGNSPIKFIDLVPSRMTIHL
jgi:RHS repeat-associated protein